jgi:hypothetical protein
MAKQYYYYYGSAGMLESTSVSIAVRYIFHDVSHVMDAFVQNKCELLLLETIREVADAFEADITIGTVARKEGSYESLYTIKERDKKAEDKDGLSPWKIAFIVALITAPVSMIEQGGKEAIKTATVRAMDPERDRLEKEKLKLDIEKEKVELEIKKTMLYNQLRKDSLEIALHAEDLVTRTKKVERETNARPRRAAMYNELVRYKMVKGLSIEIYNSSNILIGKFDTGGGHFEKIGTEKYEPHFSKEAINKILNLTDEEAMRELAQKSAREAETKDKNDKKDDAERGLKK